MTKAAVIATSGLFVSEGMSDPFKEKEKGSRIVLVFCSFPFLLRYPLPYALSSSPFPFSPLFCKLPLNLFDTGYTIYDWNAPDDMRRSCVAGRSGRQRN